ncbi:MAG TPA: hypothetical protein PKB13_07115 [Clostridia bacterium]|nr:hypothetical protein [Clostridia bacterium]
MRVKDWLICGLAAIFIAAYLIWIPPYIEQGLLQDPYSEWVMPEDEGYTGILTVWHIVGFKPYAGSSGEWLKARAKALEKQHYGIYVEVLSMSLEDCEARLARGETADIYSFPLGWGYAERFLPLERSFSGLKAGLLETGMQEGVQYAVPFMLSGYALLVNTKLAQARQVTLPEVAVDAQWLNDAAKKLTYETGKNRKVNYEGLTGSAVVAMLLGAAVTVGDYTVFQAQRAGMAVAELRAAGDLTRAQTAAKGFAFEALPLNNYTDLVQYLGIARGIDARKLPYAYEYLQIAVEEKAQEALRMLGAFPVTDAELSYEQAIVQQTYELLKDPVIPNAFLYQRYKSALLDTANRALNGDEAAKTDFLGRVEELVNGKEIK